MATIPQPIGDLALTDTQHGPLTNAIQTNRGWTNFGLRTRPLGTITIEVTGGDDAADTFVINDAGVALYATPVQWTSSHAATAVLIAQAVNANHLEHNWVATVSSATITLRQRRGGAAGTITATLVGDATVTIANSGNVSNDTDTWTEFVSGATFDGDLYYELGWSGALVNDDLANARATHVKLYCDGQAFQLWSGSLRANAGATAIVQGCPTATVTWTEDLPWMEAEEPLLIKVAADEELLYKVRYV